VAENSSQKRGRPRHATNRGIRGIMGRRERMEIKASKGSLPFFS
jgi:hypothetical protein